MNNDNNNEKIWAYLHDEMPAEEQRSFEESLKNDPALKADFDNSLRLHVYLQNVLPVVNKREPEEMMEERYLEAWERDQTNVGVGEPAKESQRLPVSSGRRSRRWLPLSALAAAAILLAMIGVHSVIQREDLVWLKADCGGIAVPRGSEADHGESLYSIDDKKRLAAKIESDVEAAYQKAKADRAGGPRIRHRLRVRMQEYPGGGLLFNVEEVSRGDMAVHSWEMVCDDREAFNAQVPDFANRIGRDLQQGASGTSPKIQ